MCVSRDNVPQGNRRKIFFREWHWTVRSFLCALEIHFLDMVYSTVSYSRPIGWAFPPVAELPS